METSAPSPPGGGTPSMCSTASPLPVDSIPTARCGPCSKTHLCRPPSLPCLNLQLNLLHSNPCLTLSLGGCVCGGNLSQDQPLSVSLLFSGFYSNHKENVRQPSRHLLSIWHLSVTLSNAERGIKDKDGMWLPLSEKLESGPKGRRGAVTGTTDVSCRLAYTVHLLGVELGTRGSEMNHETPDLTQVPEHVRIMLTK